MEGVSSPGLGMCKSQIHLRKTEVLTPNDDRNVNFPKGIQFPAISHPCYVFVSAFYAIVNALE
jgi:hypothetical protein